MPDPIVVRFPAHDMKKRADEARVKFLSDFIGRLTDGRLEESRKPIPMREIFDRPALVPMGAAQRVTLYRRGLLKPTGDVYSNDGDAVSFELPMLLDGDEFSLRVSLPAKLEIRVLVSDKLGIAFTPQPAMALEILGGQPGTAIPRGALTLDSVEWDDARITYMLTQPNRRTSLTLVLKGTVGDRLLFAGRAFLSGGDKPCPDIDPTGLDGLWMVAKHKTTGACIVIQFKDFDGGQYTKETYLYKEKSKADEQLAILKSLGYCGHP